MVGQWLFRTGVPAVALAALLWAGGPVLAQRGGHGGGGHGGGGHGGGGHASGFHGGGGHATFHASPSRGAYYGGARAWHGSEFHHGEFHHGEFHNRNRFYYPFLFYGLGYPYGYGGYGGYGYGDYGYYPYSSYDGYSDYGYSYNPWYYGYPNYDYPESYQGEYEQPYSSGRIMAGPGTVPTDGTARITVIVPPNAEVWFEDYKTTKTGTVRSFASPALTAGKVYAYRIRARWTENGQEVNQFRNVDVRAGSRLMVDFSREAAGGEPGTMPKVPE